MFSLLHDTKTQIRLTSNDSHNRMSAETYGKSTRSTSWELENEHAKHGCIKENSHQGLQHDHYWGWDASVEVQILISVSNRTQRDKTEVKCISKGCRSRITRIVVLSNTQPHEREQRVDEDVNQTSDRYRGECRKIHDRMIPIVPKFCSPSQSILSLYICRTARLIIWMLSIEDSTCVRVLVKTFEKWVSKQKK